MAAARPTPVGAGPTSSLGSWPLALAAGSESDSESDSARLPESGGPGTVTVIWQARVPDAGVPTGTVTHWQAG